MQKNQYIFVETLFVQLELYRGAGYTFLGSSKSFIAQVSLTVPYLHIKLLFVRQIKY